MVVVGGGVESMKRKLKVDPRHNPNKLKSNIVSPYIMAPIYEDPETHIVLT